MVTESPLSMLSEIGMRPMIGSNDGGSYGGGGDDLGVLLREQRRQEPVANDRERELNIFRSGSAPPTVEGSLTAVGGLFGHGGIGSGGGGVGSGSEVSLSDFNKNGNGFISEEELRSDPAYHSYYYSNVNLNPRLPPPLLSKEDWRFAQRIQGGSSVGGIGDRRKVNRVEDRGGKSLFSLQPGFNHQKDDSDIDSRNQGEWEGNGLIGFSGLGLGNRQKSFADIFQVPQPASH